MIMMIMMPPRLAGRLLGKSEPGAGSGSGASAARRAPGLTVAGRLRLFFYWPAEALAGQWQHAGRELQGTMLQPIPRGGAAAYLQIELQKKEAHTAAVQGP